MFVKSVVVAGVMVRKSIHRSEIVTYSSEEMYNLVSDISSYQHFLPYCVSSGELSSRGNIVHGEMVFSYFGLSYALETKNIMQPYDRIGLSLIKGDVEALEGQWLFVDSDSGGSQVSLDLDIKMHDTFFYRFYNRIIEQVADSMIERFIDRAYQIYGLGED